VNGSYRTIAARIRNELKDLQRVVERTLGIWDKATTSGDDAFIDAVALNLHGFYAGLERLFELIADVIDQAKPPGERWHQDLLRQMATEIPEVRPAVLSAGSRNRLDRYRGFRHVVRNIYAFNLDVELLGLLVKELRPTFQQATSEMLMFADFLEELQL